MLSVPSESARDDDVCTLSTGSSLRIWVDTKESLSLDGGAILRGPELRTGGTFLEVKPSALGSIRLRQAGKRWALRVLPMDAEHPSISNAKRRVREGYAPEAARMLEQQLPSLDWADQNAALSRLARIHLSLGNTESAKKKLKRAIDGHHRLGNRRSEVYDGTALVYILVAQERRFGEARKWLHRMGPCVTANAETCYHLSYARGLLASRTGNHRRATPALRHAADLARRLGLEQYALMADEVRARSLHAVGKHLQAIALQAENLPSIDNAPPCRQVQAKTNLAASVLVAWGAGIEPARTAALVADPVRLLHEAQEIQSRACPHSRERFLVPIHLASAALLQGELDEVRHYLEVASSQKALAAQDRLWIADISGELALRSRDPIRALREYKEMTRLAQAVADPWGRWRSWTGQALALKALGQVKGARSAYEEAQRLAYAQSLLVPGHAGRYGFLARHQRSTQVFVEFLLNQGDAKNALAVVRRARRQFIASLRSGIRLASLSDEALGRWESMAELYQNLRAQLEGLASASWKTPSAALGAMVHRKHELEAQAHFALDEALAVISSDRLGADDELRPLREGELLLAYYPVPSGWIGFAQMRGHLVVRRLGRLLHEHNSPQEKAAFFLIPFVRSIRQADEISLLPHVFLEGYDLHALPIDGTPLAALKPVSYTLDIKEQPLTQSMRNALIVGDPRGDLPAARVEVEVSLEALKKRFGAKNAIVLVGEAAGFSAVRDALGQVDLFHFAGHGIRDEQEPWRSGLALAQRTRLTVADVLAMGKVPRLVVLSGCETARTHGRGDMTTFGLAQAFIASGSQEVLATEGTIPDGLGQKMAIHLSKAGYHPALTKFVAELAARGTESGWKSFRVIKP